MAESLNNNQPTPKQASLQPATQARLIELMDRHSNGELKPAERKELQDLVARSEELMLANSEALLATKHPELLASPGRLRQTALERALRQKSEAKQTAASK